MRRTIIDELLPNDILGRKLYHYTSAAGLMGILSNNVIRCSHVFYLNDIEENLNGWEFFFRMFDSFKPRDKDFGRFKEVVNSWFPDLDKFGYESTTHEIFKNLHKNHLYAFVFSLSQVEDDLNQWRSYSQEPFGFAITFRFRKSFWRNQPMLVDGKNCRIFLRQCVYDPAEKEEKIVRLLDYHYKNYRRKLRNWDKQLFRDVLTLSLFFKNEKFKAEKECRLVVLTSLNNVTRHPVQLFNMRRAKSFLVPFIQLHNNPLNIAALRIGPTPFKYHSYAALEMLKQSLHYEYGHIKIFNSEVPYRSW